jgi:hypothetical protein
VVQEGGRRCKKSTLNDLVHLTPLRIPLMNPPRVNKESIHREKYCTVYTFSTGKEIIHYKRLLKSEYIFIMCIVKYVLYNNIVF